MQQGTSMLSGGWEIGVTGGWIGMGMRHRLLCSTAGDNEVFFDPCGVVVASCKMQKWVVTNGEHGGGRLRRWMVRQVHTPQRKVWAPWSQAASRVARWSGLLARGDNYQATSAHMLQLSVSTRV
jgi:hypothetical protein